MLPEYVHALNELVAALPDGMRRRISIEPTTEYVTVMYNHEHKKKRRSIRWSIEEVLAWTITMRLKEEMKKALDTLPE